MNSVIIPDIEIDRSIAGAGTVLEAYGVPIVWINQVAIPATYKLDPAYIVKVTRLEELFSFKITWKPIQPTIKP